MTNRTPRQRRRQKTKQNILQTAQKLVREKGLAGLSIREIARRIDYSPASLYEYFDSKDELIAAIRASGMERLCATFNRVPANLPASQRLVEMSLAYVGFALRNPEQFLLMFGSLPAEQSSLEDPGADQSPYGVLLTTVRTAIETGEFPVTTDGEAEGVAYSLWALMHGRAMLQLAFLRNFQTDFEGIHRWAIEVFIKGLQAGGSNATFEAIGRI
jgi:AcrR family transcriptional regulator